MRAICVVWAALFVSALALAQSPKLGPALQAAGAERTVNVIVRFDRDPTEAYHQKVTRRGGSLKATLHSVHAAAYSLPSSALAELAKDPEVLHISEDHQVIAKNDYSTAATNAAVAWRQFSVDGTGIGVAVIDSGISDHDDLRGAKSGQRIVYREDFVGGDGMDHYGHGEHVAGIIAGDGSDSECAKCTRNLRGMAPGANLIDLRALDGNGEGRDSTLIAAIERAIALKKRYNIRVINLSVGRPVFESYRDDPLCQAVEAAWRAGIVVVVAAGNEGRDNIAANHGYGTITAPGNDPYVITVGAMKTMETYDRSDDRIASYSSKGPTLIDNIAKPDLVAPGNDVVSLLASPHTTLASQYPQTRIAASYYNGTRSTAESAQYYKLSGTSMAAAVVSGAVADLLDAHPGLTPDQVKARLMRTAYKSFPESSLAVDPVTGLSYTSYYDIFTVGAGYLDLGAALEMRETPPASAVSPSVRFNPFHQKVYLLENWTALSAVWGASAVWGTSVVDGDGALQRASAVWGTSVSWGKNLVWGTALFDAERATWSENSILSDSAVWGTAAVPIMVSGEQ